MGRLVHGSVSSYLTPPRPLSPARAPAWHLYGQVAEELAIFSPSVDLLVVGSGSYGPVGRLLHGGTLQKLARSARCPLLVLTRATRGAETSAASNGDDGAVAGTRGSGTATSG